MSEEMEIDVGELREKQAIINEVSDHLSQISSIGNSTILIEKIKIIVNLSKQLLEGFDDVTIIKTSSNLTLLVSNAKIIAADPTGVTPEFIKSLTRSRDKLLNQLLEMRTVIDQSIAAYAHNTLHGMGAESESNSKDKEKEQLELLAKYRVDLRAKKDVQQAFILEGDPATMLEEVVSVFLDCTKNLAKSYDPGSNPSRCEILCSLCGIANSVLRLLDLVDSLFVSKFPMRKQVYSFTEKLLELGMAYKPAEMKGGREGDSIRDMRKQLPALNNSAKVMFEQLEERVRNLTASRHRSMKRKQDLAMLGSFEIEAMSAELLHEHKPRSQLLRLICHVCCTSAKQAGNGDPIKRGSVLRLEVSGDANIRELKEQLSVYTGIPVKYILPRFPGIEQPPDNEVELGELFGGGDMKDVFLFDLSSSEGLPEDEYRELRRLAVAQMTIDSYDWETEWAGDVAQATVDYDVTEPGHLSFIEGELLRVLKKNPDGWWRGEVNGTTGIFYKTFVAELERDCSTGVPTNFKQVSFQAKPKQSFLLRKKSDETILSSPAQKKKFSSLAKFESGETPQKTRTPELKKKPSHISISLDSPTEPDKPLPTHKEVDSHGSSPVESAPASEQASCLRDKEFSERSLGNRVDSVNIDELIDQLTEYSGISEPEPNPEPTTNTPPKPVQSVTNIGFSVESPISAPSKNIDFSGEISQKPLSAANPIFTDLVNDRTYDSLDGVENAGINDTSDDISEENPLYERVACVATDSQESEKISSASNESKSQISPEARPPVPTSTRPVKSPTPKITTKTSGLRFRIGKGEKEKDKAKPPSKPKRQFFGRKQKSTSIDPPLPPLPPIPLQEPIPDSNNSSANNSNPSPIGIYSVINQADIYEEVDKKFQSKPEDLIRVKPTPSNTGSGRTSHYEEVDLAILPPSLPSSSKRQSSNLYETPRVSGSVEDLYSKIDLMQKNFRKTASVEEYVGPSDEASVPGLELRNESDSSRSSDAIDLTSSCHIYSLVTRKRDSVIIQDDPNDEPVCVAISPKQEAEMVWDDPAQDTEPVFKTRPVLPPKTLSIEDVEIYIKDDDIEVGEVARSPMDKFVPSSSSSPTHKKRFSHYQDISEPQSPTLPARVLTEDDLYEEVTGRVRAFSQPHRSPSKDPTKTPLEKSHSAESTKKKKVPTEVNNAPLPPIPVDVNTAGTMDVPSSDYEYESIESILNSQASNKFKDQIQSLIEKPATIDVRTQYLEALLTCVSNLLQVQSTAISHVFFTRDNSVHTKKLIKSLEMGQPLNVDFRTPPTILASLIRVLLKNDRMGPIFPVAATERLHALIKSDNEGAVYTEIHSFEPQKNKFIRDFIYLLTMNFTGLNEKKKQEFILALNPLFFEDTSKKNIDTCKHILRYLIERYSSIFKH